ncbi:MAG: hypothetical protein J1E63_10610, partial [Muribaculaceae bacterium]|nr:hypothetical protein [Muribaculaceae bacterium]
MDKNTVWGFVLMALVFFGFMYMNRPSAEERARMEKERQEQLAADSLKTAAAPVLRLDSITAAEAKGIAATVRELGVTDTTTSATTLSMDNVVLSVGADGLVGGTINVAGSTIPAADIVYNRTADMPLTTADRAIKALRTALESAARYRGFARYLHGDSAVTRLENDLIALDLSNKGGIISMASLKKYNRYDSVAVQLMSPAETGYSFILSSEDQHFDTREFFFTPVVENDSTVLMNLDLGNGATWGLR